MAGEDREKIGEDGRDGWRGRGGWGGGEVERKK